MAETDPLDFEVRSGSAVIRSVRDRKSVNNIVKFLVVRHQCPVLLSVYAKNDFHKAN